MHTGIVACFLSLSLPPPHCGSFSLSFWLTCVWLHTIVGIQTHPFKWNLPANVFSMFTFRSPFFVVQSAHIGYILLHVFLYQMAVCRLSNWVFAPLRIVCSYRHSYCYCRRRRCHRIICGLVATFISIICRAINVRLRLTGHALP